MSSSILLLTGGTAAALIAQALRRSLGAHVTLSDSPGECLAALRHNVFELVILEEALSIADPHFAEQLYGAAGAAFVLEVNFAICGEDRVVRQARSALSRRLQDAARARHIAAHALRNELNASLTGLLLESQLALRQAGPDLAPTLQHLVSLAQGLRAQLQ